MKTFDWRRREGRRDGRLGRTDRRPQDDPDLEIAVTCRACENVWIPDHGDFVRGLWRTCPRCRGDPPDPCPDPSIP